MKIKIDIPDKHINGALAEPRSRYWASEAKWDPEEREGYAIERESGERHQLGSSKLQAALIHLAERRPTDLAALLSGNYDGETGDILLQLMAFGEVRFG
jgi:hypothetical protein